CASVKRLFRICLLLQKVEQTLHQSEGSFGGQVTDVLPKVPLPCLMMNLFCAFVNFELSSVPAFLTSLRKSSSKLYFKCGCFWGSHCELESSILFLAAIVLFRWWGLNL
ncbi:MAG: hypothetical protein COA47_17500, partial [Robiginitomaculum sp.]